MVSIVVLFLKVYLRHLKMTFGLELKGLSTRFVQTIEMLYANVYT